MKNVEFSIVGPLAYRGKKRCQSATCTRSFENGVMSEDCLGWHCYYCDAPCSSQGHKCDDVKAMLEEARRRGKGDDV